MKKKILVKGPVLSQSGYGEQARFALRALRSREDIFDIYIQPIRWGNTGWVWEHSEERDWIDSMITKTALYTREGGQVDMSLQITIPNEWERLAPINIGYTAGIETTKVAPEWLYKGNQMDKIIVVSDHSKNVFKNTVAVGQDQTGQQREFALETPIESVGYAVRHHEAKEIPGFNPTTAFNFLCVSQWGPRKNFNNTIKWWVEEFHDQKIGLILKTSLANNSLVDKTKTENILKSILSEFPNRKCKVYMLHGDLSDGQMKWLYQHEKTKCLINIAHGEGFGLPMFEAAQNALPIVTIDWSGQMDYLTQGNEKYFSPVKYKLENIPPQAVWEGVLEKDSQWANAEQGSFKMTIKRIKKNWAKYNKKAKELQTLVNERYTDEIMYKAFCAEVLCDEEDTDDNTVVL